MSAALLSPAPVFSPIPCNRISLLLQWLHSHQCPRISSIRLCTSFSSACILANTLASTLCAHRAKTPNLVNLANIYLTRASLLSDEKKEGSPDEFLTTYVLIACVRFAWGFLSIRMSYLYERIRKSYRRNEAEVGRRRQHQLSSEWIRSWKSILF